MICENKSETLASAMGQAVDNGSAHLHSGSDVDSDGGNGGDGSGSGGQSEHIAITLLECGVVTSCDADADAQDGVCE